METRKRQLAILPLDQRVAVVESKQEIYEKQQGELKQELEKIENKVDNLPEAIFNKFTDLTNKFVSRESYNTMKQLIFVILTAIVGQAIVVGYVQWQESQINDEQNATILKVLKELKSYHNGY